MLQENIGQLKSLLVILACTALGALVCAFMILVGPTYSYELFLLVPVMLAAWWGRFAIGVLLTLEITALGHFARHHEWLADCSDPNFLDEILRFCFYLLVCSLVCRFRQTVFLERTRARTDPLTGAANGRVFYEVLNDEIKRFTPGQSFTLAYLDVDNFKKVNDQLGHAAGDQILKAIVETVLKNTRRHTDTIARLGGDEFAIILAETPPEAAKGILENLRQLLLKEMASRDWPVTFSIGAMTFCDIPGDVEVLIQKVDSLMYQVKRKGKNHLCFEVLEETQELQKTTPLDRRASVRVACARPVRVNTLEYGKQNSWQAKTLDISSTGLLFQADKEFSKGTVLIVAPTGPLAGVMAKVVRTIQNSDGLWLHGCKLAQSLSMDDLQKWLEPTEHISSRSATVNRW